ncbi:PepSY-like domain-containing protein [Flavobacterium sp. JP2137]|uniref:PepSY-like domain-containing protein n=1 Tax=Flavobacterium sp. JP2137 TaxID=3414510 RepID=UPI003D3003DC
MKNLVLSVAAVCLLSFTGVSCSSDDNNTTETTIPTSDLPTPTKSFLDTYYLDATIIRIKMNIRSVDEYYEVYLSNGTEIDFDQAGNWTEVDGNHQAIPTGFIHPSIVSYVATNYPTTAIESIDKKAYGFDVDLLNNSELRFDLQGNFLGIDQ